MKDLESKVLRELKKSKPTKKRVTFLISTDAKEALAEWAHDHEVPESRAIEEMIRAVVPYKYFSESK